MLRWVVVLTCAVIVSQSSVRAEDVKVNVRTLMIRVSSDNALQARCGTRNDHPYACTHFVGAELKADCRLESGLWSLRPRAQYIAMVYILKQDFIRHESLHIGDMERDVGGYLHSLETRKFTTAGTCDEAAKSAAAEFRSTIQAFATASNAKRH